MLTSIKNGMPGTILGLAVLVHTGFVMAEESATLSGTITATDSGEPLEGISVVVSNSAQHFTVPPVAEATTNSAGEWSAEVAFPFDPEMVVVVEAAGPNHAPARHGSSETPYCFFNCGGPDGEFTISVGDDISELDISLEPGGRLGGLVTRASDGQPLESARVQAIPANRLSVRYSPQFHGISDETGAYETNLAVPPGEYHLTTMPGPGDNYVIQAWQNYSCQFERCPILDTDTIEIEAGSVTDGIDFSLKAGATLSGTLLPDNIPRIVRLYDGTGLMLNDFWFPPWEPDGDEWAFNGLAGGSYYLELSPFSSLAPWLRILHNGLLCPFSGCDRASGDPLVVPAGAALTLAEVTLESGGQIEGKLVDAATGEAPTPALYDNFRTYDIVSDDGTVVGGGSIFVNDKGEVRLSPSAALPDGDYYVRTFSAFLGEGIGYQRVTGSDTNGYLPGYVDGMYPDIVCAGVKCDLDAAEKVSVVDGEIANITIELSTGSNIEGSIVDDETGDPIPGAMARVLSEDGEILASVLADDNGQFWLGAFPDGDYYLRTTMSGSTGMGHFGIQYRYFDRLHGADSSCSEMLCDPADGTAITLDGSDAGPFELRVEPGPVISGRITAQPSGLQLSNGWIEVYDSNDLFVGRYRINPSTGKYQTTALPPGDYTLVPIVSPAYSAVTTGQTTLRGTAGTFSSAGFVVTIGTEDVSADLPVIDSATDLIFDDRFQGPE